MVPCSFAFLNEKTIDDLWHIGLLRSNVFKAAVSSLENIKGGYFCGWVRTVEDKNDIDLFHDCGNTVYHRTLITLSA